MKPGTPGFVGARLREAREARGLPIGILADLVGLSRQQIYSYEHGESTPQPESLYRIASVLGMPVPFFSLAERDADDSPTFYRSLAGATKASRIAADRRLTWVADIASELGAFVSFPEVDFPKLVARGSVPLDTATIEQAAMNLRDSWYLGAAPIPNMVALIEGHGGLVARAEAESSAIDAFSKWLSMLGRPCVFLGTEKGSRARSRFDAAHEVGHMVMHRGVSRSQVLTPAELSVLEHEANAFASAFLLPGEAFAEDVFVPTADGLLALKPKWRVSVAAMVHRATDLGIFDANHARRMWASISRKGWRHQEPGDETIPDESPTALSRAFEVIVEAGIRSPSQLLDSMPFGVADVIKFASLPPTFLDADVPIRLLDHADGRANVLAFRRPD